MEVQRINQATVSNRGPREAAGKDSSSFTSVLNKKQTEGALESLNQKMQEIDSYGNNLVESRTVENLRRYKKSIKEFMNYAIKNGLDVKDQGGFSQWGSSKTYKLVKTIDSKLMDITNAVLDKGKQSIDILGMVGEVKGMLINLYT